MKKKLSFIISMCLFSMVLLFASSCNSSTKNSIDTLRQKVTIMQKELPIVIIENEFELVSISLDERYITYKCAINSDLADAYAVPYNDKTKREAIKFLILDRDTDLADLIIDGNIGIKIIYDYDNSGDNTEEVSISSEQTKKLIESL